MKSITFASLLMLVFVPMFILGQTRSTKKINDKVDTPQQPEKEQKAKPPKVDKSIKGQIFSPINGSQFEGVFIVTGQVSNIPKDQYIWLLNCPHEGVPCWPQRNIVVDPLTGKFEEYASIGGKSKLHHDIKIVSVGYNTHVKFAQFVSNSDLSKGMILPPDVKLLTKITVIKIDKSIEKLYGVTANGIFFIHKSLIEEVDGSAPILRSSLTSWDKDISMDLSGEYYMAEVAVPKLLNRKIDYCFKIGENTFIPQALMDKFSSLVDDDECKYNGNDGHNFSTMPLPNLPF